MSVNELDVNADNRRAAAQALGALGGIVKSEAKAAAARRNLEKANAARLSTHKQAQKPGPNVS